MSQLFLAYKTVDLERANTVRAKLEALGVGLFIDQKLISGDNYLLAINSELNAALAVMVLWSEAAVHMPGPGETNFVLGEAQRGYARGVLVAATLETIALDQLPVPFNLYQAPDLSDWLKTGTPAGHREWQKVLEALGKKLDRPGLASLAVVIESGSDEQKKKFLKEHPNDPFAEKFAAELERFERAEFDKRLVAAQKRIVQRSKDSDKKLRSCRDLFESQLGELRAGRDFMPPDPVKAIDDNVAKLSNQIEIFEATLDEHRERVAKAEAAQAQALAETAAFSSPRRTPPAQAGFQEHRKARSASFRTPSAR